MSKTNNYIRNRSGNFHFFDDRNPDAIQRANEVAMRMPRPRSTDKVKEPVIAFRPAPGLIADGYVGIPSSMRYVDHETP